MSDKPKWGILAMIIEPVSFYCLVSNIQMVFKIEMFFLFFFFYYDFIDHLVTWF